jgi:spermidine/putrescine-binding protein
LGVRVETRILTVNWSDFLNIAEDSRGLGMFTVRREDLLIRAAVGRYGSEKICKTEEELNKEIERLKKLNFVEIIDVKDLITWFGKG